MNLNGPLSVTVLTRNPWQGPVLYSDCTLLYTGRSLDPRNITGAQRASSARSVSPLVCSSDCLPASPPYACSSPSHANRSTGQRNTTQSSTVLARPVCPHVCDSDSARVPASPPYACSSPSHANRSTGQRNTTQSSTVLLARPVCPHVCDSDSARVPASSPYACSSPSQCNVSVALVFVMS